MLLEMATKKSKPIGPKTMMFKREDLEVIQRLKAKYQLEGLSPVQIVRVILRRAEEVEAKVA